MQHTFTDSTRPIVPPPPMAKRPSSGFSKIPSAILRGFRNCFECRCGKRGEKEVEFERLPSWHVLGAEFTERTTWHGLKYVTIPTPFPIRKFIWAGILLGNAALFLYIMITNLEKLFHYPSSINVQVSDNNTLPFAAVTICNENKYKLTALQESGLYDLLVNDYVLGSNTGGVSTCDEWELLPGVCHIPALFLDRPWLDVTPGESSVVVIEEVTRAVCRRLCTDVYNLTCSSVLYNRARRNCTLSAYTGEWIDGNVNNTQCIESKGLEFYKRIRCIYVQNIYCNFEDASCQDIFTNDTNQNDLWSLIPARGQPVERDNTLNLASGHILNLLLTEMRPGYAARVQSPFINTTNKFLTLFYWFQIDNAITSEAATLKISLMTEELEEIVIAEKRTGPNDWSRLVVPLPDGIYQILISGQRGSIGSSGISVDDISVQENSPQQNAVNHDCKVSRLGRDYVGSINVTTDGQPCLSWDSINSPLVTRLPDASTTDAQNFCRNIPQEGWQQPSCFVSTPQGGLHAVECAVPFCPCQQGNFQCNNKMCIPTSLQCNGVDDCLDRSDEITGCQMKRTVECLFSDNYICGYEATRVGLLSWTRQSASDLTYYSNAAISSNVSVLEQLVYLDSKLGEEGDQIQFISPLWTFPHPTLIELTYVMMGSEPQSVAGLFVYQYSVLRVPVRLLLSVTNFDRIDLRVSQVCVPAGTYHLMFLGIHGVRYQSDIGLDIVRVGEPCNATFDDIVESFNCSFSTTCGYTLQATSALITSSIAYTKNAFRKSSDDVCSNVFFGVNGVIRSPGFPGNYANNLFCEFRIEESYRVIIEITFDSFSLESQDDCLYDSLEIIDTAVNETDVYCGSTLPPKFYSKGSDILLRFRTDSTVTSSGFKLTYKANIVNAKASDYMLDIKYRDFDGATTSRHSARLTSPPVSVTQPSCLRTTLVANSNFNISIGYVSMDNYMETLLLSSSYSLGPSWQKLNVDLSPSKADVAVIFDTGMSPAVDSAFQLSDVTLLPGTCRQNAISGETLSCTFDGIDQCGYLDNSEGPLRWERVCDVSTNQYYMKTSFEPGRRKDSILQSSTVSVNTSSCLRLTYYSSSRNNILSISSTPRMVQSAFRLLQGIKHLFVRLPLGTYSISFNAFQSKAMTGVGSAQSLEELRIYEIFQIAGSCPMSDNSIDVNCDFEDVFICEYVQQNPFGLSWNWVNVNNYQLDDRSFNTSNASNVSHGNVMLFNTSAIQPVIGVLLSPQLHIRTAQVISLDVYKNDQSQLQIFRTTVLGEPSQLLYTTNISVVDDWQTIRVCLPAGEYRLAFVAQTAIGRFLAIDNVLQTEAPCSPPLPASSCLSNNDLSNCIQQSMSWSPVFAWKYTSNIYNDSVIPAGDACLRIFYEVNEVMFYNQTGKHRDNATCDIYIKGIGPMIVSVWFYDVQLTNCSNQYVQIWWHEGSVFKNQRYCQELLNQTAPLIFNTVTFVQIHVQGWIGLPTFTLRYSYTPNNVKDYALALYYIGPDDEAASLSIPHVAELASSVINVTSPNVCITMDMALPASTLEIVLLQTNGLLLLTRRTTIFESDAYAQYNVEWKEAVFQIQLDRIAATYNTVQFIFYLSLSNYSLSHRTLQLVGALNNLHITDGPCKNDDSGFILAETCWFGRNNFCAFRDISDDISKWTLNADRAKTVINDKCKVTRDGIDYKGTVSTTVSGRQCQRWDLQYPQQHNQDRSEFFSDSSIAAAADHCRNPLNPFIPRTPWCYTLDPGQRREYCDVQYCLEHYLQVVFLWNHVTRATLASQQLPSVPSTMCLSFSYLLTSPFVTLQVAISTTLDIKQMVIKKYSIDDKPLVPQWSRTRVELPSSTVQMFFIADKIDTTDNNEAVALDNVTVEAGPCMHRLAGNNGSLSLRRVPYNGKRLAKTAYQDLVLNDISGKDMSNITQTLSHQLPQLIQSCKYAGKPCDPSEFVTEFTELGMCYTFNFNSTNVLYSAATGADYGAQFIFNVESYEHVKGYVSGVGVKIHLHDQTDIPIIKVLGFSAPPAMHSLAGMRYTQTYGLTAPHGTCGANSLSFYGNDTSQYTYAKCLRQHEAETVETICKCKDSYMPGQIPVCNLRQYLNCTQPAEATYRVLDASCPLSCNYNSYAVELSQSKLSELALHDLFGMSKDNLTRHYLNALEIRHRITEDYMVVAFLQITDVIAKHKALKQYVYFTILDHGTSIPAHIEDAVGSMQRLVVSDFVAGGTLVGKFFLSYERRLRPVLDYIANIVKQAYDDLGMFKEILWWIRRSDNLQMLQWYTTIFNRTVSHLQEFQNSMTWLATDLNNFTTNAWRDNMLHIRTVRNCMNNVSLPALQSLITRVQGMSKTLKECQDAGLPLQTVITQSLLADIQSVVSVMVDFTNCTDRYGVFLTQVQTWLAGVDFRTSNYSSAINAETILGMFNSDLDWLQSLLNAYAWNQNMSKHDLDIWMHSNKQDIIQLIIIPSEASLSDSQHEIANSYYSVLQYLTQLNAYSPSELISAYARSLQIWRGPVPNLEAPQRLQFNLGKNETWQVWPMKTDLQSFVNSNSNSRLNLIAMQFFDPLRLELMAVLSTLTALQKALEVSVATLLATLDQFESALKLDETFASNNFVAVDIFFGEMKYQKIEQSIAYDWTNFFSDMGSYFGLLMGCSVLTFFEVVDLAIYYGSLKLIQYFSDKKKKQEQESIAIRELNNGLNRESET